MKKLFVLIWIISTAVMLKINFEYAKDIKSYQQKTEELKREKKYYEQRYGQTLENDLEAWLARDLHFTGYQVDFLTIGKDFERKNDLEGLITINRGSRQEDYRFKVIFDRNGLPLVTELASEKVVRE